MYAPYDKYGLLKHWELIVLDFIYDHIELCTRILLTLMGGYVGYSRILQGAGVLVDTRPIFHQDSSVLLWHYCLLLATET